MAQAPDDSESKIEAYTSGVQVVTTKAGDGKTFPKKNELVIVKYRGYFQGGKQHGKEFDTCMDEEGYKFRVGEEIKGWNQGIKKMSLNETAIVKIPYKFAYGIEGNSDYNIPGCQDLKYEITLVDVLGKLPSGVQVNIIKSSKKKDSEHPAKGDKILISYVGTFHGGDNHDKVFETTNGKYYEYEIGVGKLIRGWDEGIPQMKYGDTAILKISSDYAYGAKGARGRPPIPPNQDLQFKVHLKGKSNIK